LVLGFLTAIVKNQVESIVLSLWACLCNPEKQLAPRFCSATPPTSKNMQSFPGRIYFFWACLCNTDEQSATKLCGTSLQSSKNKLIFLSLLSLWSCLCNPNEQPAAKLCGAISQNAKNKPILILFRQSLPSFEQMGR
jgi:hypothetical protein